MDAKTTEEIWWETKEYSHKLKAIFLHDTYLGKGKHGNLQREKKMICHPKQTDEN